MLSITPIAAAGLAEMFSAASTEEEVVIVRATLQGGDLEDENFHLVEQTPDGPKHYRGNAKPAALERLKGSGRRDRNHRNFDSRDIGVSGSRRAKIYVRVAVL